MNFSVVVRFFRETVGMFCDGQIGDRGWPGTHTWSTVARVQSGLRTLRLAFLRPSKACCVGSVSLADAATRCSYWRRHFVHQVPICTLSEKAPSHGMVRKRTDVEQNCAIVFFVDDVVLEDLVVQGLWGFHCRRHVVSRSSCYNYSEGEEERANKGRKNEKTGQQRKQVYLK